MWHAIRNATNGCQCELRDDWSKLLDSGVDKRSPELTINGKTCLACTIEGIYEEAIGSEIFDAEMISEIKMKLGDHSVIVQTVDDNGAMRYVIAERAALEKLDDLLDHISDEDPPSTD